MKSQESMFARMQDQIRRLMEELSDKRKALEKQAQRAEATDKDIAHFESEIEDLACQNQKYHADYCKIKTLLEECQSETSRFTMVFGRIIRG